MVQPMSGLVYADLNLVECRIFETHARNILIVQISIFFLLTVSLVFIEIEIVL